jgi:Asp-tRNA(Asn)/Glu-tRNA(Gln) amidotransferase C subunit
VQLSQQQAEAVARTVGLDLPAERVEALARQLSDFMTQFEAVRAVEKGDREPSTLTWEREA